jgi:cation/acetate symporter
VELAFAVAASTFCPLLVLGTWWRGLTTAGALAGLLTGGTLATVAVLTTIIGGSSGGLTGALLAQPAAWTVPAAFVVMVAVSLLTRSSVPVPAGRVLARLHAPETLGLDRPAPG